MNFRANSGREPEHVGTLGEGTTISRFYMEPPDKPLNAIF